MTTTRTNRDYYLAVRDALDAARSLYGFDHPDTLRLEFLEEQATHYYLMTPDGPAALEGHDQSIRMAQQASDYADRVLGGVE